MEKFKRLLPEVERMEPLAGGEGPDFWKAYDASGTLLGYAFAAKVPETIPDIPGMDEMDRYIVAGMVDPKEHKIINVEISLDPEGPAEPWTKEITGPAFQKQYVGLTMNEIDLSPDGKIDAITDATMSSTWITNAIRDKVSEVLKRVTGQY
ncbi:MAG: FMN-binding protein [Thermodesulfobacteriota bacterium]